MDARRVKQEARWALSLLACGMVVVFAEGFRGRAPTMRDFVGFTFPSRAAFRALIEGGDLSSWNPLSELGLSRLAAPVHGALYPGHVPLLFGDLETGVVLTWILHAAWAGLGGYCLARAVGARPFAAVISGAVWAFGGYAVSMWWNGEKVLTGAWLPWFALGIERASTARALLSPGSVLAALAAAMICYAGDPFLLLHAVGLAAAVLFARSPENGWRSRVFELVRAALATAFGLGLAAPVLSCALYLRGDTSRNEPLMPAMAEAWSAHPARLMELFVPGYFGNPFDVEHYAGAAFADDPTRQALPWAVSVYAGAAFLVFAPCLRRRRVLASLGSVAVLFMFLACGRHTPLNALATHVVPGLSLFRYPEKHLVVVVGLLGLLAALGAGEALKNRPPLWRLSAAPVLVIGLAMALAPSALRANALLGGAYAAVVSLLLIGCVLLAPTRTAWAFGLALVAVLDLAVAGRPFLQWAEQPLAVSPFADVLQPRVGLAPPRIYRPRSGDFEDAMTLPGAAGQVFGIAALPGHDPASSVRLSTLLKLLADQPERMAQLFALDAFVLPADTPVGTSPVASLRGTSLYLRPRPVRAWMVGSVRLAPTADAMRAIASERFDPYGEAIVAADVDPAVVDLTRCAQGSAGMCAIVEYDRAHLDVHCNAERDGLMVLSELFADGWSAAVDGHAARIFPADLVLRGVPVEQGVHRITMRYETPGLAEGTAVAAASAVLLLLGLLLARFRASA
ncbi:MAG TPA: YfhO family protein [Polyangiaceae bacterium]|nr:YfhO family protein [Polyangiaceae bacterium]